ncbi:MAG: hypothetical protein QF752_06615 [Planctomycetota bacterium]|nr:hypothetical protein [Planctomycetota bacterium]
MIFATFVIDPPALFLVGVLYALMLVHVEWRSPTLSLAGPFGWGWLFVGGFYALAILCYQRAPAWMTMYFLPDETSWSVWVLGYLGLVLYAVPYALGFVVGVGARRRSPWVLGIVIFSSLGVLFWVGITVLDRYQVVGTREEFLAGTARPLWDHTELMRLLLLGTLGLSAWVVGGIGLALRNRRRRLLDPDQILQAFSPVRRRVVQAFACRLFPVGIGSAHHAGKMDLGEEMSRYMVRMPWMNRVGLGLMFDLIQFWPYVVRRKPGRFTSLCASEQDRVLHAMESSRSVIVQSIFHILKVALCLLYWERPEVLAEVGAVYHGKGEHRSGWEGPE